MIIKKTIKTKQQKRTQFYELDFSLWKVRRWLSPTLATAEGLFRRETCRSYRISWVLSDEFRLCLTLNFRVIVFSKGGCGDGSEKRVLALLMVVELR